MQLDPTGISRWYSAQLQLPLFLELWQNELKFGHSFCSRQFYAGMLYPIEMGWQWGGGWLAAKGFSDFAGSTLVHAAGGAAALAGAIVLGPRLRQICQRCFDLTPYAASSIPLSNAWRVCVVVWLVRI